MLFLMYITLVIIITFLSIRCAFYLDRLESITPLSGAFLGGVVLAAITALPELATSVSAVTLIDNPSLLIGNIFGSNIFNLSILASLIILFINKFKKCTLDVIHNKSLYLIISIYVILLIKIQFKLSTIIFNVDIISIFILIIYFVSLKILYSDSKNSSLGKEIKKLDKDSKSLIRSTLLKFIIASMALVVSSVFLTLLTDKISDMTSIGSTLSGALFLGITNSIPEVATCVTLCKLGNFNSSFGNIIGSIIFNCNVASICDFIYRKGSVYSTDNQSYKLIIFGLVSTVLTLMILKIKLNIHKKNAGLIYFSISCLILSSYLCFLFL